MTTLKDLRDYSANDGEEYWIVNLADALNAIHNELNSWPDARLLNPTTGEIKEAPLRHLIGSIAEAITSGHEIRVEPIKVKPERHIVRVVAATRQRNAIDVTQDGRLTGQPDGHSRFIPGPEIRTLTLEDGNVIEWPEHAEIPSRVEMVSPGNWRAVDE
jgi:hypothetical protein